MLLSLRHARHNFLHHAERVCRRILQEYVWQPVCCFRFLEDKLRQKDATIDKLRLKNTTTKALITKMEHQLAHKEEMGEVLHLVDFDQLKIENQQYMEKIEERNIELLKLKLSTSRTVQVLNNLKSQLSDLVAQGHDLRKQIAERKADLARFDQEFSQVGRSLPWWWRQNGQFCFQTFSRALTEACTSSMGMCFSDVSKMAWA